MNRTLQALTLAKNAKPRRLLTSISASSELQIYGSYHEKVIDHYENPRNVGSLDKDDPSVGTGLVGAPACGDVMKLQIKVCNCDVLMSQIIKSGIGISLISVKYVVWQGC